ncbi:MAG: hypothetical protein M3144_02320 [Actinomycetota bacterium]|nr:hypothetical protein [Actinomycetota bacterium]
MFSGRPLAALWSSRPVRATLALLVAVGAARLPVGHAAWVANAVAVITRFAAAPDWVAPMVESTAIAKATGYLMGSIRQGGTYYVYARVSDSGNPPSGVAVETAEVTAITPSGTGVNLVSGSYSAGGATYTHRSALLTAATPLAAGNRTYSTTSRDAAGNLRTQMGHSVTVDNTPPVAAAIQTANMAGGVSGRAESGDTVTFTYSEPIDPYSILAGWNGLATNVVVRLIDGGCTLSLLSLLCNDDSVRIYNAVNASQLPLGSVNLNRGDYHGTTLGTASALSFGAGGTPSTMVASGSAITVILGTASGSADTAAGAGAMVWAPSTSAYDGAGNTVASMTITEAGTSDKDF